MGRCASMLLAVLGLLLVLVTTVPAGHPCPRPCSCHPPSELHCTFRSLLSIPPRLPKHSSHINLGFNSISRIGTHSFSGLKKLELLMLHGNDIQEIPDATFRDLGTLQVLKLSYNKLSQITAQSFSGLSSVLRLHLDHNRLRFLHPRALLQLPALRLLRLQGNQLHQLHPQSFCTLSLIHTYCLSTLRHLDISNNSLSVLHQDSLATAPLLETLGLQANPWSCDCSMAWLKSWSLKHPGVLKCPGGPQCPVCDSPNHLKGRGLIPQTDLPCTSPVISSPHRDLPREEYHSEIQPIESWREQLGHTSLTLSDQQGNNVDLSCNVTDSAEIPDITPADLSSMPIDLSLSLSLDCPVERGSYERVWRLLAYYSETAVRLDREIMLSKPPQLAYRYRQAAEREGYYHTGVRASVTATPHWLMQPTLSLQLDRVQSGSRTVKIILSTSVSAQPAPVPSASVSSHISNPWVFISTNHTPTALAVVAGSRVELACPVLSSAEPKLQWVFPDGSHPSPTSDGRVEVSSTGLILHRVQLSDAGLYHCVARVGKEVDVLPVRLAVEESSDPAPGEQGAPAVIGLAGEPVSLPCKTSGSPAAKVSWVLPDGRVVKWAGVVEESPSSQALVLSDGSLSLPLPDQSNVGQYRCVAVNQHGVDALSTHLSLTQSQAPPLRAFPRMSQLAARVSTRTPAPSEGEGSGYGQNEYVEEEKRTPSINRKRPRPAILPQTRWLPPGLPHRHVPGQGRRKGPPVEQRRNRLEGRRRVNMAKHKIDPQRWADILAKIRLRTALNATQPTVRTDATREPTAQPISSQPVTGRKGESHKGSADTTEGSSIDDAVLREEGLQAVHTHRDTNEQSGTETDTQTETGKKMSTSTVPTKTIPSLMNQLNGEQNGNTGRTRPQDPRQGTFINSVPTRPRRPWDARRRLGPRRRINKPVTQPNPDLASPDLTTSGQQGGAGGESTTAITSVLLPTTAYSKKPTPSSLPIAPTSHRSPASTPSPQAHTDRVTHSVNSADKIPVSSENAHTLTPAITPTYTHTGKQNEWTKDVSQPYVYSPSLTVQPFHSEPTAVKGPTFLTPDNHEEVTESEEQTSESSTEPRTEPTSKPAIEHTMEMNKEPTRESVVELTSEPTIERRRQFITSTTTEPTTEPTTSLTTKTAVHTVPASPASTINYAPSAGIITSLSHTSTSLTITTELKPSPLPREKPSPGLSDPREKPGFGLQNHREKPRPGQPDYREKPSPGLLDPIEKTNPILPDLKEKPSFGQPDNGEKPNTGLSNPREQPNPGLSGPQEKPSPGLSDTKERPSPGLSDPQEKPSPGLPDTREKHISGLPDSREKTNSGLSDSREKFSPEQPDSLKQPSSTLPDSRERSGPALTDLKENSNSGLTDLQKNPSPGLPNPRENTGLPDFIEKPSHGLSDSRERTNPGFPHSGEKTSPGQPNPIEKTNPRLPNPTEKPSPGLTEQGRQPPVWTNLGVNTIPDSHGSRPLFPFPPSLPVSPGLQPGPQPPLLRVRPRIAPPHVRSMSVPAESTALLPCPSAGEPTPVITWTKVSTGAVISTGSRGQRFEVLSNGTFIIQSVQLQDRGTYICTAENTLGRDRMLLTLEVWSRPPRMQLANYREVTVHQGGEVEMDCQADGVPAPLLSWVLPNRSALTFDPSFNPGSKRVYLQSNGTLRVSAVLPGDRGVYRCVASNPAGSASTSVRLHVSSLPPVIQQVSEEVMEIPAGLPLYTHCSARGAPPPALRWQIPDGTLVRPSQFLRGNLFIFPNGTLLIRSLVFEDAGSYECTASNTVGSAKRTVRVKVTGGRITPAIHGKSSPLLTASPSNKIRIPIVSSSLPLNPSTPQIPSPPSPSPPLNNSRVATSSPLSPSSPQSPSSPLSPNSPLSPSHPRSPYPPLTNSKVSPSFPYSPSSPLSKAKIISTSPPSGRVTYGSSLMLHCSTSGSPQPTVIWRTPSRKLADINFSFDRRIKVFPNGSLSIQAVTEKDGGDYLCVARNKVGDDFRLLRVTVVTKPAKIEYKQPSNQKVSYGEALKVDCQASGLPDPAVRWSLPDGTMVNSVLQGADRGGRTRRLVVFDNGTLFLSAVGMKEEGEYTCYAENQGGMDQMKVRVRVLPSPPSFPGQSSYEIISVRQGGAVTLRCGVKGEPSPTVTWLSPANHIITQGSWPERVLVMSDGSLVIQGARGSDGGNYTCRASNTGGVNSRVVGLQVQAPYPTFTGPGRGDTQILMNGQRASWGGNGVSSKDSSHAGNGRVPESSAAYSRVGTGVVSGGVSRGSAQDGDQSSRSSVNRGAGMSARHKAVIGQTVLLPCPTQKSPLPRLTWLLPGNGVIPVPFYGSRVTVHRNGSLELRGVRGSDAGMLVCVVNSEDGEERLPVHLEVSETPETALHKVTGLPDRPAPNTLVIERPAPRALVTEKPAQIVPVSPQRPASGGPGTPESARPRGPVPKAVERGQPVVVSSRSASLVSIINGENLHLSCPPVPGFSLGPQVTLSWTLPNGVVLSRGQSGGSGRISVREDGTLTVLQASVYDRGSYSCRSTNHNGTYVLTVPVIVIAYPPRITTGPSPLTYTRPGVAVQLTCLAIATPRATITWETPDQSLLQVTGQARVYGNRYLSSQGALIIQNPSSRDTGFYRCTARNVIGTDTKATYLHVI